MLYTARSLGCVPRTAITCTYLHMWGGWGGSLPLLRGGRGGYFLFNMHAMQDCLLESAGNLANDVNAALGADINCLVNTSARSFSFAVSGLTLFIGLAGFKACLDFDEAIFL